MTGGSRLPVAAAVLAALALTSFGFVRGTWAAGGSDSSCYALMADAFAHGRLQPVMPLALDAPWPDAALTFTPAGFIPSPVRGAAASPVCAPGFSLLMTPLHWIAGPNGVFAVTPIAAGLLVWDSFQIAAAIAGGAAGVLAAALVATAPIVLFQSAQPMNDVATAALWFGVLAAVTIRGSRRAWIAGALAALAILVRPNLAPLAVVIALTIGSMRGALAFTAAAAPGAVLAGVLNWQLYGHPLQFGYGQAAALFSASYVPVNARHYARTLMETETILPLVALAAPLVVVREQRRNVWRLLAVAATTASIYLFYKPFDEWWYLRFWLPAVAALIVLAAVTLVSLAEGASKRWRRRGPPPRAVLVGLGVALLLFHVRTGARLRVFDLQRLEARFRDAAQVAREQLPANALYITVWESGTMRFHARREAVLWDALAPGSLDTVIQWSRAHGFEPFLLLERWEEPAFRDRFSGASAIGALDWPPRFDIDRQVRIYAPADRAAYFAGSPVPTQYIWPRH